MSHHNASGITPDEALARLKEGNAKYLAGAFYGVSEAEEAAIREKNVAEGQHPIAAVIACSDSRSYVERVFNVGLGSIFTVRTAGNSAGKNELGSVEYAVAHLGVPLVVVMGHTRCGAITAAVGKAQEHGALAGLLQSLEPVVAKVQNVPEDKRVDAAIKVNVEEAMVTIRKSGVIAAAEREGRVKVVGAIHDIANGKVNFL